jgi:tetrahydromethanopterin S-methyltransferase subunit G
MYLREIYFGHCSLIIDHLFSLPMTNDITLTDILNQMQIHASEFRKGFLQVYKRIDGLEERIDGVDGRLDGIDGRLDGIDGRLDGIDQKLLWNSTALQNIDKRLDDIELEFLPKRVSRIEKSLELTNI